MAKWSRASGQSSGGLWVENRAEIWFDFFFFQIFQPFLSLCLFVNFCESGAHSYHFYGKSTSSPILKIGMCWGHLSSMGLIPTVLFLKYKKYEVRFTTYLFQNVISYLPSVCPNWMLYCTLLGYLLFWEKKDLSRFSTSVP